MSRAQLTRVKRLEGRTPTIVGVGIHTLEIRGDRGSGEELLALYKRDGWKWLEVASEADDQSTAPEAGA